MMCRARESATAMVNAGENSVVGMLSRIQVQDEEENDHFMKFRK